MTFTIVTDAAGAATVTVGGYELLLDGHCVDELVRACESLLDALRKGDTALTDADIRPQLPGVAPTARLHAWMFPCFMVWMPVLVFATDGPTTAIYTRTVSEEAGMPLVVLDERDLEQPVTVATAQVISEATAFLAAAGRR